MYKILCIIFAMAIFSSCFKAPEDAGFLSNDIYLKGADTIDLPIGGKGETNYAWMDGSSQPCNFSIENIRDDANQRSNQFFKDYTYRTWIKPYNFQTDTTEESVMNKLVDKTMPCFFINKTNGQLLYVETSSNLRNVGDVFHVDVRVTNSKGSKVYNDYAILKLTSGSRAYTLNEAVNGIIVVKNGGNNFVYYDQINSGQSNFLERRNNIYADNGKEFIRIHKLSNDPATGVKIMIKFLDAKGVMYDPQKYATYSSGTHSYIDVSINRKNTKDGMEVNFPTTPWPVTFDFMSYLKGPTSNNFTGLNLTQMQIDFDNGDIPSLIGPNNWPSNNWADASAWYVRLRSKINFYESGTWEIACTIPYTAQDGIF